MALQRPSKADQLRTRKNSYTRTKAVKGEPCPICGEPGNGVHHIIPIRFGGSYGRYNLMACCSTGTECHSHDRLNRLSYHWVKTHAQKHEGKSLLQLTRICRVYILDCISRAKLERDRRASLRQQKVLGGRETSSTIG